MSWFVGLLLGIVQGITEFLPVSSSSHLALLSALLNGGEDLEESYFSFFILLHLATLAAVIVFYRRDVWALIKGFFSLCGKLIKGNFRFSSYTKAERSVILIVIATIPLVPAAVLNKLVSGLSSNIKLIGVFLLINCGILCLSDWLASQNHKKDLARGLGDLRPLDALIVGVCQMFATLPGISRSGSTITGGISRGMRRSSAVKLSFLMSIPAILGANILDIPDMLETPAAASDAPAIIIGFIAAFVFGFVTLRFLTWIAKKDNFRYIGIYCAAVGLLAIIFG